MRQKKEIVRNVPMLRFPEFRHLPQWGDAPLKAIFAPVNDRVGEKVLTPVSISAGIGFVPQSEKFGRDISGNQYGLYTHVRRDDFVYNKGNSIKFPQGCVYCLNEWDEVAAPNVFICFRLKKKYSKLFYQYCFEKNIHGDQLRRFITSGARSNGLLNISKTDFFDVKLPLPELKEQQKIADCLSSLDELIAAQTKKLDMLKAHKKGLMRQLFPAEGETVPRLRFPEFRNAPKWDGSRLGNVSMFIKEKVTLEQLTLANYVSTENILADYDGVTAASKLPPSGTATRFKINDILISNIRPYLKKIWFSSKDGGASNDVLVIRSKMKVSSRYLAFLLKNDEFINYVMKGAKGVKMPRGDISLMKEYPLAFPSLLEQQKIADCLSSLDNIITANAQKIESLKFHKKGLIQQLFPSADEVNA